MKSVIEHHDHHHWHIGYGMKELFLGLLILVTITAMVRIIETKATESNTLYEACLDACVEKPFGWTTDIPEDFQFDYDRTECIRVCNSMLQQVSGATVSKRSAVELAHVGRDRSATGSLCNDCGSTK